MDQNSVINIESIYLPNSMDKFFDCISDIICINQFGQNAQSPDLSFIVKSFTDKNIQIIDGYDENSYIIPYHIRSKFNRLDNKSTVNLLNNLKAIDRVGSAESVDTAKSTESAELTDYYLCIINTKCIGDQMKTVSDLYLYNNVTLSTIIKAELDKNIDFDILLFNNCLDWYVIKKSAHKKVNSIIHYSDQLENIALRNKNVSNFSQYILNSVVKSNYAYNEEQIRLKKINSLRKIVLVQQYFEPADERKTEIDRVLQLNLSNPFISKIYLLNEKIYDLSRFDSINRDEFDSDTDEEKQYEEHKLIQFNIGKRLTFTDSFNFGSKLNNYIVIFANLDIEIGSDIEKLNSYKFDNRVYCLTRYDINYTESTELAESAETSVNTIKDFRETNNNEYMFSQDTWIYSPLQLSSIDTSNLDFFYGVPACDNVFITELNKQNIDTFNIPFDIKTIHHHRNVERNYSSRLSNPIMPLYSVRYDSLNKLIRLKIQYNLSSVQLNYFMKVCDILNLEQIEYEEYLNKLLGNAKSSFEDLEFIKNITNLINDIILFDLKDVNKFIQFIEKFYYYKKLFVFNDININNINELNNFINQIISYIFIGKKISYSNNLFEFWENKIINNINYNLFQEWSDSFNELKSIKHIINKSNYKIYDNINSFLIYNNMYLFFDIFHKNNELILICPINSNDISFIDKITIIFENKKLEIKKIIKKLDYEQIIILIYFFDIVSKPLNIVNITYNNKSNNYILLHKLIDNNSDNICLTTLFKNDFKNINIFYDYYIKQGVDFFFMYYNGIIDNEICEYYNKQNILLIEWNFMYWNIYCGCLNNIGHLCSLSHYAQIGQIHHALYKYGKNEYKYIIYNDLDEYFNIDNYTLKKYILNNEYDIIQFRNCWANEIYINNNNKSLPNSFYITPNISDYKTQSKNIYKTSIIDYTSIHCIDYNKSLYDDETIYKISKDNIFFHFYLFSNKDRSFFSIKNFNILYNLQYNYINNINSNIKIPNIIFFIFGFKKQTEEFLFCYYLSVYSAYMLNNPDKIEFYYHYELYGEWFDKLKEIKCIEFIKLDIPKFIGSKPIKKVAHIADKIRMEILYNNGGIYMDIDTISVRSYKDLLYNHTVLGLQTSDRICNAIMMTTPKSAFFDIWINNYEYYFDPDGWEESSIILPFNLYKKYPNLLTIVEPDVLFLPSWHETEKIFVDSENIPVNLITLHLWETYSLKYMKEIKNWDWINNNSHTMYGKIMEKLKNINKNN
jgi:hypothetical protein